MLISPPGWSAACTDTVDRHSPVLQNGFAGNLQNTRNNPSSITSETVTRLQLAYAHAADATQPDGSKIDKRGAVAVTQQAVFLSSGLKIVAMNRVSGCIYWTLAIPAQSSNLVGPNAVRSSALLFNNSDASKPALVYAGDTYGNYYAVNAVTGKLVWSRFVGTDKDHHMMTGGAQLAAGKLLVPVSTKEVLSTIYEVNTCCVSHGLLLALDPYTGANLWTFHTTANATYQASTQSMAPNGAAVWGTPAVDLARNRGYIGTGQNLTPPTTKTSDAVIAVDLTTGKALWSFQTTANDAFNIACVQTPMGLDCKPPEGPDFDIGAAPILATLPDGSNAVIAGTKGGMVYSLNPDTGAVNWQRRVGAGGVLGGIHWGMATDAQRVYVGVSDVTINKSANLPIYGLVVGSKTELVPNAKPGLYALDLASGALVWERHPQHLYNGVLYGDIYSAAVSVTNDVLFAGSLDGRVRALRTSDGSELWSALTTGAFTGVNGVKGNGGGIDSVGPLVAGGDLLVNSGYATFGSVNEYHGGAGNGLMVYRLR